MGVGVGVVDVTGEAKGAPPADVADVAVADPLGIELLLPPLECNPNPLLLCGGCA